MKYLRLIRWPYLLVIILGQFLIKYAFFESIPVPITLNTFGMSLISLSTFCIAAAGFIIHDLYKVSPYALNLPYRTIGEEKITVKKAFNLFFAFNVIGIITGFYLANMVGSPSFAILFILASALLYAHAKGLQKYLVIRSLIISGLGGLAFLSVALFDLFPVRDQMQPATFIHTFSLVKDYAVFFILLFFVREQIINQKNMEKDQRLNWKTLSGKLGLAKTNKIIFILSLIPILGLLYYIYSSLYQNTVFMLYALVFILAPLAFVAIKILSSKTSEDYKKLQNIMSLTILFTVLSIGLLSIILPS